MHQGDAVAVVGDGVLDGGTHDAPGAFLRDRFDADAGRVGESDLAGAIRERLGEERREFFAGGVAVLEFNAGVDVLGILAEDNHVGQLRLLHGTGHALKPAHRA